MNSHAGVYRVPGVSFGTHTLVEREASSRQWRLGEKRAAIAAILFERRRLWVSEEEARNGRPRSLMEDNPAGG
jgi:hypothetical protein